MSVGDQYELMGVVYEVTSVETITQPDGSVMTVINSKPVS